MNPDDDLINQRDSFAYKYQVKRFIQFCVNTKKGFLYDGYLLRLARVNISGRLMMNKTT
jgi:hypothetical protein